MLDSILDHVSLNALSRHCSYKVSEGCSSDGVRLDFLGDLEGDLIPLSLPFPDLETFSPTVAFG